VVTHEAFSPGGPCPHCQEGILYRQKDWSQVVRLIGQPPVGGQRYELERLRCGLCGKTETAPLPEKAGPSKYDPTVAAMIAALRYGQGLPWNRIEQLQQAAGIPLPASVQWERVRDAIDRGVGPAYRQLLDDAAQGSLMHNDDTYMRILDLTTKLNNGEPLRDDEPDRRGVFTTNLLSTSPNRPTISLFFTGPQHSGENLRELLAKRMADLPPPIQMCDALSRNMPSDLKTIVANCLSHARRNFYELADVFPCEVQHVLEIFKQVYKIDAQAKLHELSPDDRLQFHQQESGPLMDELRRWLNEQFDERKVEPNSSLGKAIAYMQKHWEKLTLFLRVAGAPLDNNVCERALKMSIRHRRNSLFYKSERGAKVGDAYMSLIHTCQHSNVDSRDYLTQLQRHHERVATSPADWMPWNYRRQLASV
jgi:transposase